MVTLRAQIQPGNLRCFRQTHPFGACVALGNGCNAGCPYWQKNPVVSPTDAPYDNRFSLTESGNLRH